MICKLNMQVLLTCVAGCSFNYGLTKSTSMFRIIDVYVIALFELINMCLWLQRWKENKWKRVVNQGDKVHGIDFLP